MDELGEYVRLGFIILAAATAGEGIIEFIPVPLLNLTNASDKVRTAVLNLLSATLGVVLAINFHLALFIFLGAPCDKVIIDFLVTGCLIGRGSNWVHAKLKQFLLKS